MDRRQLWRITDKQKSIYRMNMKPVFLKAFDKQIQPLYDKISQVSDIRDVVIPPLNNKAIEEAYQKLYLTTAVDFAKRKRLQLKKGFIKQDEDEIFEDLIMDKIRTYLRLHAGETVTAAGDTSITLIQQLLKRLTPEILDMGIGGGAAQTMLRDMIQSEWHQAKYFRTERIVRTEVNRASNWGSLEGTKSLGVEMNKVWISAFAPNSRQEHMDADGQPVDLEEPFIVWDEPLQYPGDPEGRPENTINCLCSIYEELK
jgi:hypothetical protein